MALFASEVETATLFLKKVPDATRERVLVLAGCSPPLLSKTQEFESAAIPLTAWHILHNFPVVRPIRVMGKNG